MLHNEIHNYNMYFTQSTMLESTLVLNYMLLDYNTFIATGPYDGDDDGIFSPKQLRTPATV